jgi:hypothetical protein
MQEEAARKADEGRNFDLRDVLQLFFPYDTNRKQLEYADKFMKKLLEEKKLDSTILKTFLDGIEYRTVIHVVIPKLQNFGLIRIEGQRGKGKSYTITLDKKFSDRLRYLERGWFRIYAKYGDLNGG